MIGRVLGAALGALIVAAAALALGFRAYQAYLEWLVGGTARPPTQPASTGAQND